MGKTEVFSGVQTDFEYNGRTSAGIVYSGFFGWYLNDERQSGGKKHKKGNQFNGIEKVCCGFNYHAERAAVSDALMINDGGQRNHGKKDRNNNEHCQNSKRVFSFQGSQ